MSRRKPGQGRGRLERLLFSFMGPPQLGDASAPVRHVEPPVTICATCSRPHHEHEIVRSPRLTYSRCPPRQG